MEAHRIVIVGAGFAGLRTALELEKRCARIRQCEILLIDRNAAHLYTPLLYEVATGEPEQADAACAGELRQGLCVRFDDYVNIVKKKHVRFRRATVTSIDAGGKTVTLNGGERVSYDDLVVAVGSEPATYGVPGVSEHARMMKTLGNGFEIRDRLHAFLKNRRNGSREPFSLVVAGAGATGTEFVAETANLFRRFVEDGVLQRADYRLTLVEAGPNILAMLPESVRQRARDRLVALGVDVMTGTKLKRVGVATVTVADAQDTESEIPADLTVWTAGIKPSASLAAWGLPVDERGSVKVSAGFAVEGVANVYALGDCVSFLHPRTKQRVPALAQAATREGAVVAENVARKLERKMPMLWNPPERWVSAIPLGGRYAIADFGWLRLYGRLGYAVRKLADLQYFLSILPPREAWKLWRTGGKAYAKND